MPRPSIWTGSVDTNWFVRDNWEDQAFPDSESDVVIRSPADNCEMNGLVSIRSLNIGENELRYNGSISIGRDVLEEERVSSNLSDSLLVPLSTDSRIKLFGGRGIHRFNIFSNAITSGHIKGLIEVENGATLIVYSNVSLGSNIFIYTGGKVEVLRDLFFNNRAELWILGFGRLDLKRHSETINIYDNPEIPSREITNNGGEIVVHNGTLVVSTIPVTHSENNSRTYILTPIGKSPLLREPIVGRCGQLYVYHSTAGTLGNSFYLQRGFLYIGPEDMTSRGGGMVDRVRQFHFFADEGLTISEGALLVLNVYEPTTAGNIICFGHIDNRGVWALNGGLVLQGQNAVYHGFLQHNITDSSILNCDSRITFLDNPHIQFTMVGRPPPIGSGWRVMSATGGISGNWGSFTFTGGLFHVERGINNITVVYDGPEGGGGDSPSPGGSPAFIPTRLLPSPDSDGSITNTIGQCCCGTTGCPTCTECPNGSPRQWRFSITGVVNGALCPCSRMNGNWTVTWTSDCVWEYSSPTIVFRLRRAGGQWFMAITFPDFPLCSIAWGTGPGDPSFCCLPSVLRHQESIDVCPSGPCCGATGPAPFTITPVDTDCCRSGPCCNCSSVPNHYTLTVAGVTNNTCDSCNGINRNYTLERGVDSCVWHDVNTPTTLPCGGSAFLGLQLDCDDGVNMSLTFAWDVVHATYRLPLSSWSCLGVNTLNLISNSNACANWPATLTLTPI